MTNTHAPRKPKHHTDGRRWSTADITQMSYLRYYDELVQLCISRFRWLGLPQTIDKRYLEWCLFYEGKAVIHIDPQTMQWKATKCTTTGTLNEQEQFTDYRAWGNNGYNVKCAVDGFITDKGEVAPQGTPGVIVWDNNSRSTLLPLVELYAWRLSEIDRATDTQVFKQKYPLIIETPIEQTNSVVQDIKQSQMGEPVIIKKSAIDVTDKTLVVNTQIPFTGLEIQEYKRQLLKEFYDLIGLETLPMERENIAAIALQDEHSQLRRLSYEEPRRLACEWLTNLGLPSTVVWNRDSESDIVGVQTDIQTAHKYDLLNNDSQAGARNNAVNATTEEDTRNDE